MKPDATVLRETRNLLIGLLIVSIIVNFIYVGLGKWNYTVATGTLLGTLAATANFFFLGLTVQHATAESTDPKKVVHLSYGLRMLLMASLLVCGIVLPYFDTLATLIPFLMMFPIILILKIVSVRKE